MQRTSNISSLEIPTLSLWVVEAYSRKIKSEEESAYCRQKGPSNMEVEMANSILSLIHLVGANNKHSSKRSIWYR